VNRYFGVSVGKLETLSPDDPNEFAQGKGDTQFFNLAFNINPVLLMVPYSTLVLGTTILIYSAGVGAKGLIPGRDLDQFGLGYYYSTIRNPTLQVGTVGLSLLQDEWGFEAYYNAALTPWLLVSPDIQVIGGAQKKQIQGPNAGSFIDNAVVLGFRLQVLL